jgi:hypothetical protein
MAAPEYVPRPKAEQARVYESPPWRFEPWLAERPADLDGGQPIGERLGYPGPDQGFMLRLARSFEGKLALADGEREEDVLAGACAIALRRASLFGRAPVIHDLTVALKAFGYLDDAAPPPADLVAFRRPFFDGVANHHHYAQLRELADMLRDPVLRRSPRQLDQLLTGGWRRVFEVDTADAGS